MKTTKIGRTAAIANYLIERVKRDQVNLCELRGGGWVTIRRGISRDRLGYYGFDQDSPPVAKVYEETH